MDYYLLKRKSSGMETISIPAVDSKYWDEPDNASIQFSTKIELSDRYLPIYIGKQILINKAAYSVIRKYQTGQLFKYCALIEQSTGIQQVYLWLKPFEIDCLHETTKRNPDRTIKKLILNKKKIGCNKIFRPKDILEPYLIIDLEILEKLLCAGVYPLEWEKVECI